MSRSVVPYGVPDGGVPACDLAKPCPAPLAARVGTTGECL